jgi:hypothetical protein
MDISRITKHLFFSEQRTARAFSRLGLAAIEAAIQASEASHAGEICFAVEGGLDGLPLFKGHTARERASEVFSQLRVWDTAHNNGVLIYVLLADQAVEIVADRGAMARVDPAVWESACAQFTNACRDGRHVEGVISAIDTINQALARAFPSYGIDSPDELPNEPLILR